MNTPVNDADNESLREYVERAKNGNDDAFRALYELFSDRLFAYALLHTKNREVSADLLQDTFIDLWKGLRTFRYINRESFLGFVFIILKRKLARFYEERKKRPLVMPASADEIFEHTHEYHPKLAEHIDALPEQYKDVVHLRYFAGLSFSEIASVMNINLSAAKILHHRAIKKLEEKLLPHHEQYR